MKKYILMCLICLLIVTGCNKEPEIKTLTCSKDLDSAGIPMVEKTNIKFIDDKIDTMVITIVVNLPEMYKDHVETFMDEFNTRYAELYKGNEHINFEVIKKSDLEINVVINIDYVNMTAEEKTSSGFSGLEDYATNKTQLEKDGHICQ
jgi:hypothetical protein